MKRKSCHLKTITFFVFLLVILLITMYFVKSKTIDDTEYIGTFYDYDVNEPSLFIERNENGTYKVKIEIFRLADFEDKNAKITKKGILFKSIDPAENIIYGKITTKNGIAIVEFINSTWSYIENGQKFRYRKSGIE